MNERRHHSGIGEDAEEEDGEDEHGDDRGVALNAGDDESGGMQAEACGHGRKDRDEDERSQRGKAAGENGDENAEDGQCSPKGHT